MSKIETALLTLLKTGSVWVHENEGAFEVVFSKAFVPFRIRETRAHNGRPQDRLDALEKALVALAERGTR